jgi:hypothetical protein
MVDAGPWAPLAGRLLGLLVQAVGAVVMIRLGWDGVKTVVAGNVERAGRELLIRLLVIGFVLWGLANPAAVVGIAKGVAGTVATAVAEAVQQG